MSKRSKSCTSHLLYFSYPPYPIIIRHRSRLIILICFAIGTVVATDVGTSVATNFSSAIATHFAMDVATDIDTAFGTDVAADVDKLPFSSLCGLCWCCGLCCHQ